MHIPRYIRSTLFTLPFFLSVLATKAQDLKFAFESVKPIDTTNCAIPTMWEVRESAISSFAYDSSSQSVKPTKTWETFNADLDKGNWLLPENYRSWIRKYLHTQSLLLSWLELQEIWREKWINDTVWLSLEFLLISNTQECKENINKDIESIKKWIKEQYDNLHYLFLTIYPFHQNDYDQTNTVTLQISEEWVKVIVNYKKS